MYSVSRSDRQHSLLCLSGCPMEQLAIFREPSHEPSAAPDDGLEKAGRKKRMPKREFGIER